MKIENKNNKFTLSNVTEVGVLGILKARLNVMLRNKEETFIIKII
uniref:Transposase n=1 Tax=Heterorhabditis bacteriophora TaxID=37862 RepID=A0A1I7WAY7_HETBA